MSEALRPGVPARPPTSQQSATVEEARDGFDEGYFVASQWQLMRRKFVRHKLAIVGLIVLAVLYFAAIFAEFFATQDIAKRNSEHIYAPPQRVRFFSNQGFSLRPFVYPLRLELNRETFRKNYHVDKTRRSYIRLFQRGDEYEMWTLFRSRVHLIGVDEGTLFLLGTDRFGRDIYSRVLYAARTSLSIGLIGGGDDLHPGLYAGRHLGLFWRPFRYGRSTPDRVHAVDPDHSRCGWRCRRRCHVTGAPCRSTSQSP